MATAAVPPVSSLARNYREEASAFDDFLAGALAEANFQKKDVGIAWSEIRSEKNFAIPAWTELPREGMAPTRYPTPRPQEVKKEEAVKAPKRSGPVRVLVLHGICSSGSVMKKQLARLAPMCKGKIELVYIDGPIKANEDTPGYQEMASAFKNMEFYDFATMATKADTPEAAALREQYPGEAFADYCLNNPSERYRIAAFRKYNELDNALAFLQNELREKTPIDGVMGFGAGANMAGLLAAQAAAGVGCKLDFAIMICPGKPGYREDYPDLYKDKIEIRSMHLSGNLDFTNPPHCLAENFEDPQNILHSDGYRPIPGTNVQEANEIAKLITDFILDEGDA